MVPIIFDLVFVAIIVLNVIIYAKKGFVSTVLQLLTFGVAFLAAYLLSGPLNRLFGGDSGAKAASTQRAIVFMAIFIIVAILMGLLQKTISKTLKKIPLVGTVNTVLGGVVGLLFGFLYAYLAVSLCAIIIEATKNNPLSWMNASIIEKTWLVKLVYRFNLLTLFPMPKLPF